MKILFFLLLISNFAIAHPLVSITYYVDQTGGNDANAGTSEGTAWKTVAKVNASTFAPTDMILFKRGEVWNESLVPPSSGTAGNTITFGAYGTGARPLITGFTSITGMSNVGNIWSKTIVGGLTDLNTVVVNGAIQHKARYPDEGYVHITSHVGATSISGASFTGHPDFTGAEAVVRSAHYIIDVVNITSNPNDTTLNLSPALTYAPTVGGNGFFVQNTDYGLNQQGEWTYNSGTGVLKVYSVGEPEVKISNTQILVDLQNKLYITIEDINFDGANLAGAYIDTCRNITIQNCNFKDGGNFGVYAFSASQTTISSDSFVNTLSIALYMTSRSLVGSDTCTIVSNYIRNTGIIAGAAPKTNFTRTCGIYIVGRNSTIEYNRIDSVGYIGVNFYGKRARIYRNYISSFNLRNHDGGGIYTWAGPGTSYPFDYTDSAVIRGNIVTNGVGDTAGTTGRNESPCIYLDWNIRTALVDSNTIWKGATTAVTINIADSNTFRSNNIYNGIGDGVRLYGRDGTEIEDMEFKDNLVVVDGATNQNFARYNGSNVFNQDSNYYAKAVDTLSMFGRNNQDIVGLGEWRESTGADIHSNIVATMPITSAPLILFNWSSTDSTFQLGSTYYYDKVGTIYTGEVVIQPYRSLFLWKIFNDDINYIESILHKINP